MVSLAMEEALMLRMELPSPNDGAFACKESPEKPERPEMEEAPEARPLRGISVSVGPEDGRRSGKRAVTRVMISLGEMTMNGCTSTVSRGEVIAFAGRRTGLEAGRLALNRERIFSM